MSKIYAVNATIQVDTRDGRTLKQTPVHVSIMRERPIVYSFRDKRYPGVSSYTVSLNGYANEWPAIAEEARRVSEYIDPDEWQCLYCDRANHSGWTECRGCGAKRSHVISAVYKARKYGR